MPKKTASARGGAHRNKPKTQKNIQLVRQISAENELEVDSNEESTAGVVATSTAPASVAETKTPKTVADTTDTTTAPKSASARLAARRQVAQKTQRSATTLITAEHYSYVRKDLLFIAILAIIMFSAIIILHFVPAIGG